MISQQLHNSSDVRGGFLFALRNYLNVLHKHPNILAIFPSLRNSFKVG